MKKKIVKLTQELADLMIVPQHDGTKGFQRKLYTASVSGMVTSFAKEGIPAPAIQVAEVNGDLIVYDGQHRLAAWQQQNFPLFVEITQMKNASAARSFVRLNSRARKVSRAHINTVSPEKNSRMIRKVAEQTGLTVVQADSLLSGVVGLSKSIVDGTKVTPRDVVIAVAVGKAWMDDKRFTNKKHVYGNASMLRVLGNIVKNAPNRLAARRIVKRLQNLNYTKGNGSTNRSGIAARIGSAYSNQKDTRLYILSQLSVQTDILWS